ncbi:TetR/AcrR family transcriptional regulator [Treponema sp. OttesenSCG-928-L16]|nr:TetR/AcrR family transcriptional regulator [Treponema sp. OttesenSCG-928-L16]
MDTPEQDVRITKTRKALSGALLHLLETNSFLRITVNDICREALVSRSTFYVHFYDKFKLLKFCMENFRRGMEDRTSGMNIEARLKEGLQVVYENRRIFRNIFFEDPNQEVQTMFREHFLAMFRELFEQREREGKGPPVPPQAASAFCAGGLAGIILWWIESDYSLPAEDIAAYQYILLSDILPREDGHIS